jgi:hypothetical protein
MCGDKVKDNPSTDKEGMLNKKTVIFLIIRLSISKKDVIRILN